MRMSVVTLPRVTEPQITSEMRSSVTLPDGTITKVYFAGLEVTKTGQSLISQLIGNQTRLGH
jgi:hypothetical protein